MRNLIIALVFAAQPSFADQYFISIPSVVMAKLTMEQDVPPPAKAVVENGSVWGVVDEDAPSVAVYLAHADEIIWMDRDVQRALRKQCGTLTPSCVQHILSESGHD